MASSLIIVGIQLGINVLKARLKGTKYESCAKLHCICHAVRITCPGKLAMAL